MRHPGAKVTGGNRCQRAKPGCPAVMARQKGQIAQKIGLIGLDGIVCRPVQRFQRCQIAGQRVGNGRGQTNHPVGHGDHDSQRRIDRSNTPAKKANRSVP